MANKRIRDMSLIPSIADTAVLEIDDGTTAVDYKTTIAQLKSIFGGVVSELNIIYVGKHGNDSNVGTSIQEAKLTFAGAAAAASSGDVIVCFDNGTYTESIVSKAGVNIYAPNIILDGNHAITHGNRYQFGTMIGPISGLRFGVNAAVEVELSVIRFILTAGDLGFLTAAGAKLNINAQHIEVGNTFLFADVSAGDSYLEFEEIIINGTGIVMGGFSSSNIHIRGSSISDTGSGTLFQTTVDTTCSINCARVNIENLSDITVGTTANLIVSTLQGTQNETGAGRAHILTAQDGRNFAFNSTDKTITGSFNTTLTTIGSAGVISGGTISDAGSGNINTLGGNGLFRKTSSDTSELVELPWNTLSGSAIPLGAARYVGVTYNGGSPAVTIKTSDTWNNHTEFRFGSVVNEGGTLHILNNKWRAGDATNYINERFYETAPFQRADRIGGLILGETGTRNVTVSAGELYDSLNEFVIPNINTSGTDTFDSYLGATQQAAAVSQWDNDNYNNGGVLTSLDLNKYANLWWFIEADGDLVMVYGTGQYVTSSGAEAEGIPATIPLRTQVQGRLIGRYIFQKGAATAILIESAFVQDFTGTTTNAHNNLSNRDYDSAAHGNGFTGFQRGTTLSISDPTVNDDTTSGYVAGDMWTNTASGTTFTLLNPAIGAAVWRKFFSSSISANYVLNGFNFPAADGTINQVMYTDGSGTLAFKDDTGSTIWQRVSTTISPINPGDDLSITEIQGTSGSLLLNTLGSSMTMGALGNNISIGGITWPTADGSTNQLMYTNGAGQLAFRSESGSSIWQRVGTTISPLTSGDDLQIDDIQGVAGAMTFMTLGNNLTISGLKWPTADGAANQIMYTDGAGNLGFKNDSTDIIWKRTGTTISPTTVGDDLEIKEIQGVASGLTIGTLGDTIPIGGITWPASDGTPNQVMKTDGAGNLGFTTISGTALDQILTFFVAKSGSDGNSGKSDDSPFLTIGKALSEASLLGPSVAAPIAIKVIDAGIYTENRTALAYVYIFAPQATFKGQFVYVPNSYTYFYKIQSNTQHCFASGIGSGTAYIKAEILEQITPLFNAIDHVTSAMILSFDVGQILLTGTTSCRGINAAAACYGRVKTIEMNAGASPVGIYYTSAGGRSSITVEGWIRNNAATTTTGVQITAGQLMLNCGEISSNTAYNQSGGIFTLNVNELVGTRVKTAGIIHSVRNDLLVTRQLNHVLVEERTYITFTNNSPAALDDTQPTSTEGSEIFTTSYTTGDAANVKLIFRLNTNATMGVSGRIYCGLYVNGNTTPVKIGVEYQGTPQTKLGQQCTGTMTLSGNTTYTLRVRIGSEQVAGIYINGRSTGRDYGGATGCSLEVEEYEVI